MDDQAEYITSFITGKLQPPSKTEMLRAIEDDRVWQKSQYPDRPRYGLELDPHRYRKALARDYRKLKAS